jgi:hypothetical protein
MKTRSLFSIGSVVPTTCALAACVLVACQTYDFEPVKPYAVTQHSAELEMKATPLPPNIMLLLDKSGSMGTPIPLEGCTFDTATGCTLQGGQDPSCNTGNCNYSSNNYCPQHCSTRINALREAMHEFLEESREIDSVSGDFRPLGKFGLTLFPERVQHDCDAPTTSKVPLISSDEDNALKEQITAVQNAISALYNTSDNKPILGGTPTGNALKFLLDNVHALKDEERNNFVLLLTDGLPNCNLGFKSDNLCPANQCRCTTSEPPGQCTNKDFCGAGSNLIYSCLDENATVEVIRELREKGIETIVIGFGSEVSGGMVDGINVSEVLNNMAHAGGSRSYFPAADKEALLNVLRELSSVFDTSPCVFKLSGAPADASFISVYIDDKRILPGPDTYEYDKDNTALKFQGELCTRLENSSSKNPVRMRISVLQEL